MFDKVFYKFDNVISSDVALTCKFRIVWPTFEEDIPEPSTGADFGHNSVM